MNESLRQHGLHKTALNHEIYRLNEKPNFPLHLKSVGNVRITKFSIFVSMNQMQYSFPPLDGISFFFQLL